LKKVKDYRIKNLDKIKRYKRDYNKKNHKRILQYQKEYRQKNKDYFKKYNLRYRKDNREKIREKKKEYISNLPFETRMKNAEYDREYYINHKGKYKIKDKKKRNEYLIRRYKENLQHKIAVITRSKINKSLRDYLNHKKIYKKVEDLIGITIQDYIKYIEGKFQGGMTWGNRGTFWNIDHILPINSFDLKNKIELKKCFNYLNTRPTFKEDNHYKRIIF
jgi:hypothetical protein